MLSLHGDAPTYSFAVGILVQIRLPFSASALDGGGSIGRCGAEAAGVAGNPKPPPSPPPPGNGIPAPRAVAAAGDAASFSSFCPPLIGPAAARSIGQCPGPHAGESSPLYRHLTDSLR